MPIAPGLVPSVEPTSQGRGFAEPLNMPVPVEAFGGAMGRALQQFGGDIAKSSDEIWTRAQQLQGQQNETAAKTAATQYEAEAGAADADFKTREGVNAGADALKSHIDNLEAIRQKYQDQLPNPDAQRMYQGASQSFMARMIGAGANWSAAQVRNAQLGAAQSRIASAQSTAAANPGDQNFHDWSITRTRNEAEAYGRAKGWEPDEISNYISQQVSQTAVNNINAYGKTNPIDAQRWMERDVANGTILPADEGKLADYIQRNLHSIGSRQISHDISAGHGLGERIISEDEFQHAIGKIESSNNYNLVGPETGTYGHALGRYQVMSGLLAEYAAKAGVPTPTEKEFLSNPALQDRIGWANFNALQQKYGTANDAASAWLTGQPRATAGGRKDVLGTDSPHYVGKFEQALAEVTPLSVRQDLGRQRAEQIAPNDPAFSDAVAGRIDVDHNRQRAAQQDDIRNAMSPISDALLHGGKDGGPATTLEELQSNPAAAKAYEWLGDAAPAKLLSIQKALASNARGNIQPTHETDQIVNQYIGMAENDTAKFLNSDPHSLPIPFSDREKLVNLQREKIKSAARDPNVSRAMGPYGVLRPLLDAAGIDNSNKIERDKFTGALRTTMQDFINTNKRPPHDDETLQMGSRLLQVQTPGFFKDIRLYQATPTEEFTRRLRGALPDATDEEVQRAFTRDQYNTAVGGNRS